MQKENKSKIALLLTLGFINLKITPYTKKFLNLGVTKEMYKEMKKMTLDNLKQLFNENEGKGVV